MSVLGYMAELLRRRSLPVYMSGHRLARLTGRQRVARAKRRKAARVARRVQRRSDTTAK